jgi:hypothetical protein
MMVWRSNPAPMAEGGGVTPFRSDAIFKRLFSLVHRATFFFIYFPWAKAQCALRERSFLNEQE